MSLRSVETASPREIISIFSFRSRADSVMKTLAASFGSTLASARARAMPAFSNVVNVSRNTVYTHIRNLKEKTDSSRMVELIGKLNDVNLPLIAKHEDSSKAEYQMGQLGDDTPVDGPRKRT